MAKTYIPIATSVLSSAASGITFSSISGSYTDLRLVVTATSVSSNVSPYLRFNSDTGTNYSITYLGGSASASVTTGRQNAQATLKMGETSGTSTTVPIFITCDIFTYSGTSNHKNVFYTCQNDTIVGGQMEVGAGLWRNTSAITTVFFGFTSGNIAAGSIATLYGILKA